MALTKKEKLLKEKLINCIKNLKMPALDKMVRSLEKRKLDESDLNATLTRIIYEELFTQHLLEIIKNPGNKSLKEFCTDDIGPIKLTTKPTPRMGR